MAMACLVFLNRYGLFLPPKAKAKSDAKDGEDECSEVRVAGAEGPFGASVNGVFAKTGELHNGRPLFQKRGEPQWFLRLCKNGAWAVSSVDLKHADDDEGAAISVQVPRGDQHFIKHNTARGASCRPARPHLL
jgi:hypothetical protein